MPSSHHDTWPVADIAPVDGWQLRAFYERDSDGFATPGYIARGAERDVWLDTSRFGFHPTQERFELLVRAGFPKRPTMFGGWCDESIDAAIAQMKALAA